MLEWCRGRTSQPVDRGLGRAHKHVSQVKMKNLLNYGYRALFLAGLALGVPSFAIASPTYLKCEVAFDKNAKIPKKDVKAYELGKALNEIIGSKNAFELQINEENKKVLHIWEPETGYLIKRFDATGDFRTDKIYYSHSYPFNGDILVNRFDLDRTSLAATQTSFLKIRSGQEVEMMRKNGSCKVLKLSDRKI
jgi:hypothetical protein